MHDMTAKEAMTHMPHGRSARISRSCIGSFPTSAYLRARAPRNVPRFSFEYGDTGAGADVGIAHNWAAFDAIKVVPRYGVITTVPPIEVELFGTRYAAPIGIAPMGGPSLVWPGADLLMAKAAQRARVPYTLGVAGGATIEDVAKVAPDVFWLQLYRFSQNDHKIGFDLIERAQAAGVKVLALTIDVPVRTTRSRESYAGLGREFHPNAAHALRNGDPAEMADGAAAPRLSALRHHPRNMPAARASTNEVIRFRAQATWAACFPGRRSRAIATAGRARCWSKASCIRPTPRRRCRSASRASGCRTMAAARSRRWRASIDVLPAIVVGGRAQGDRRARQRHPLGPGRDARAGARRQGGLRRQVVPVGGRRARRRRARRI